VISKRHFCMIRFFKRVAKQFNFLETKLDMTLMISWFKGRY